MPLASSLMPLAEMQLMETNSEAKVVTLVKVVHLVVDQLAKEDKLAAICI